MDFVKTRRQLIAAAAAAPLGLMATRSVAQAGAADGAARELAARFVDAWNRHDVAAMAATYAEGGSLVDPFQTLRGRSAIEQGLAGLHAGPARQSTSEMVVSHVDQLNEHLLFVDASQLVSGMLGPEGKPLPPTAFVLNMVLLRDTGGWRFRNVRVNFAPPPAPRA
jgi:uncharacterized protein (TIGR02246 family)